MASLRDIKPSISRLPRDEGIALIIEIRNKRRNYSRRKQETTARKLVEKAINKLSADDITSILSKLEGTPNE